MPSSGTQHFDYHPDISGVPGTGKTATVHAVVRELKRMAESNVRGFLPLRFEVDKCEPPTGSKSVYLR